MLHVLYHDLVTPGRYCTRHKSCIEGITVPCCKVENNWNIAPGVDAGIIDSIKCEELKEPTECLRRMLLVWLKQINPLPTWKQLADVVKAIDASKAQEITIKYCDKLDTQ